jgi:UDPglucose--hexose-1-phosphate uridylyltransferase
MSELRKDPLCERWVIISTERGRRPTDFKIEKAKRKRGFCPFDPGNENYVPPEIYAVRKVESVPNDSNWELRVVPNKFPALGIEGGLGKRGIGMYDMMNGIGAHEVIIETPNHDETIDIMPFYRVKNIVTAYKERIADLHKDKRMKYVLVFKNFGVLAGASLEHSHSQLISLPILPKRVSENIKGAEMYYDYRGRCAICDMLQQELYSQERIVEENDSFVSLCPFASRFPFEMQIIPRGHQTHYEQQNEKTYNDFASILKSAIKKLAKALDNPPYNFVLQNAPFTKKCDDYYHWFLEIMPRLTRIAGFEWGSGFYINPTPPEEATKFLKNLTVD